MQIPFPYEIINRYLTNNIYKNDMIKLMKSAFCNKINSLQNNTSKKYYQLDYNRTKGSVIYSSSKIIVYNFLLFDDRCDNVFYYNYIDHYMNDKENIDERIDKNKFIYTINNISEEICEYSEYDNLLYIDLMCVFDKFFNQHSKDFNFELKETRILELM
jgi:hypothetical protein